MRIQTRLGSDGIVDNRYHILPFIGVYGLIPFAFIIIGNPDRLTPFGINIFKKDDRKTKIISNIIYLFTIMFIVAAGEIVVGTLFEKIANVKLWDYSDKFLHITRYTCLKSILGFGCGTYLISKFVFFPLYKLITIKSTNKNLSIFRYLYFLITLDMLVMIITTIVLKSKRKYWQIRIDPNNNIKYLYAVVFLVLCLFIIISIIYILYKYSKTYKNEKEYEKVENK